MQVTYKFLIADDHPLFREALHNLIGEAFEGSQRLETADLPSTLAQARAHDDIDLILLDLNMPGMQGLSGLLDLRREAPSIPVAIVSAEQDRQVVVQAITCGAAGFIGKSAPRPQMIAALKQILRGEVFVPSDLPVSQRASDSPAGFAPHLLQSLTPKQMEVFERMSQGDSNKQIAWHLDIAETTVKAHVSEILRKLKVHNRVQAILGAGKR